MKFIKNNFKLIIGFIVGMILASSITVYAYSYFASDIKYTNDKSVADALNDLYKKSNKTPTQVTTLTTQGATYTMQNDGYIVGTAQSAYNSRNGFIYFNDICIFSIPYDNPEPGAVSLYAPKGTVVSTRTQYGTYNLTVYEWK